MLLKLFKYSLRNAPWAVISSLSAGVSNYIIIIVLAKLYDLTASGQYRISLSIIAILGLTSLMDTGKVLVKYTVMNVAGITAPLLLYRMKWSVLGVIGGLGTAFYFYQKGDPLAPVIMVAALLLPFRNPMEMYGPINQAKREFRQNAINSTIKFTSVTLIVVVLSLLQFDIAVCLIAYMIAIAAFNTTYTSMRPELREPPAEAQSLTDYKKQSLQLSLSGVLPILLEQSDKLIISYAFGLEALGLYTVGVSTGRLIPHFVKPVLTIYFPILVDTKLSNAVILTLFALMTVVGLVSIPLSYYYFQFILDENFLSAFKISAVILVGLGVHAIGTASYYSAVYHNEATIRIPAFTNIVTFVVIITYLFLSAFYGGEYALILCAASFPLRELVNFVTIRLLNWKQ